MFTLVVVDFCSMNRTLEYICHVREKIVLNKALDVVIVDNSPTREGFVICNRFFKFSSVKKYDQYELFCSNTENINLVYVYSDENLGYARGNNLGVAISDEIFNNEYYLISNNDLILTSIVRWEDVKHIFNSNEQIAVIGPKITGLNGTRQSPHKKISAFKSLIAYYWISNRFFDRIGDLDVSEESKICYRVMGSFMFVRAEAFRLVDGFDSNTFMYAEEMILSERLLKKNYVVYYYNDIEIIHGHDIIKRDYGEIIRSKKMMFESCYYYFERYRKSSKTILFLAKISFNLNMKIRCVIKKSIMSR